MVRWLCILCFVVAFWPGLGLIGSGPAFSADYSPARDSECGKGTDVARGCAAVRARTVVDAGSYHDILTHRSTGIGILSMSAPNFLF